MTMSGHIPTFLVKQHITMMVNRYEVTSANPDGTEGSLLPSPSRSECRSRRK